MTKKINSLVRKVELDKIHYKLTEEDSDNLHSFVALNNVVPSLFVVEGPFIYNEAIDILKEHFKENIKVCWELEVASCFSSSYIATMKDCDTKLLIRVKKTYKSDVYVFPKKTKFKHKEYGWIITHAIEILYDCATGKPDELIDKLSKIKLVKDKVHNNISLICQDSDGLLYTKDFRLLKDDFDFDLELHYGKGFNVFHDITVKRIDDSQKGIILLHGSPGSGKTYYIRRIIRDLIKRNKKIIYLPSSIVDSLGTPAFNNFLMEYIEDSFEEGDKSGILLIIEDAEKVLLKREQNPFGGGGVSTILNSTDGILNDFLNIQILATFNCSLEQIDTAILRKKRAISIKEFKKLNVAESQKLIDHLKINHIATEDMSLADIYSLTQLADDNILLADRDKVNQNKLGFNK